jgi:hypothetical protein
MQGARRMIVVKPTLSMKEQAHSQYRNDELPPEMGLPEDTSGDPSTQTTPGASISLPNGCHLPNRSR